MKNVITSLLFLFTIFNLHAAPPVANFNTPITSICEGSCIIFTNTSTFIAGATFSWDFGDGQTSNLQNPTSVCYLNPGVFTVTLIVTDGNGSDTQTNVGYITVGTSVTAGFDGAANLCNTATLDLNTLLSGADPGGTWTETTGTPSGQFTAGTGVFDATALANGVYTFDYTLTAVAPCLNDVATISITVSACTGPTVVINASSLSICQGQSIIFNDASTGVNLNAWSWSFGGGVPGTAAIAGPISVQFNSAGTFNIQEIVVDDNGTSSQTIQVTVTPCSTPNAAFAISDNTICPGSTITYTNNTNSTGPTTYFWTFAGGSPATSTLASPGPISYSTPGTYNVSLLATNSFGNDSYSQNITVVTGPTIAAFGSTISTMGAPVTIGAVASAGTISWTWNPDTQGSILTPIAPDYSTVSVTPIITTTFAATVTSAQGCTASDLVVISVDYDGHVGVPTMFSPDLNGENDVLYVKGLGIVEMLFRVYNRYGQLVFESTNPIDGWDGYVNGSLENSATFVYTLDYTLVDGTTAKTNGNITLVR